MSEHDIVLVAVMFGSFVAFAACARVLHQANAAHVDMIRRHERWREESRQQWDADMAALNRMAEKLKAESL